MHGIRVFFSFRSSPKDSPLVESTHHSLKTSLAVWLLLRAISLSILLAMVGERSTTVSIVFY